MVNELLQSLMLFLSLHSFSVSLLSPILSTPWQNPSAEFDFFHTFHAFSLY